MGDEKNLKVMSAGGIGKVFGNVLCLCKNHARGGNKDPTIPPAPQMPKRVNWRLIARDNGGVKSSFPRSPWFYAMLFPFSPINSVQKHYWRRTA